MDKTPSCLCAFVVRKTQEPPRHTGKNGLTQVPLAGVSAERAFLHILPAPPWRDNLTPVNKRGIMHNTCRLTGRSRRGASRVEESPHSAGHDAGEIPGGGNLSDRATETNCRAPPLYPPRQGMGRGRRAARVKRWCKRPPARVATSAARQPPSGARPSRDEALTGGRRPVSLEFRVGCPER